MDSPPERAIHIRQGRLFKSFLFNGCIFINDISKQFAKTPQAIIFIFKNIAYPKGDVLYII